MFRQARQEGREGARRPSRARRATPAFEALEGRQLLSRTLPFLQGGSPNFRTVTVGQAQYTVRVLGPGQMHLRHLGPGLLGVDLYGTTEASTLSVTRSRVGAHFRGGSLSLGRIAVKSGALGVIDAPVATLQGDLTTLGGPVQAISLGGIGPRGRVDVAGPVGTLAVGTIGVGPAGLVRIGGGVGELFVGAMQLDGGRMRVDGSIGNATVGTLALRRNSEFVVGGDLGPLGVAGGAAVAEGSRLVVGGDATGPLAIGSDLAVFDRGVFLVTGGLDGGLSVGRDAIVAGGALLGVGRDAAGTLTVGDDLLIDGALVQVGRDLQGATQIADDLDIRGGGRLAVSRDVLQPFAVGGDAAFAGNGGLFVGRNLNALRVDGDLDTSGRGFLRVGGNLDGLRVGGVIEGRRELGTAEPDIRVGLDLNDLVVLGMIPNRGGIAGADIDVIKNLVGVDVRHGIFDSLITVGVLIDGGDVPGSGGNVGPDGPAAVKDSQIRAGVQIRYLVLGGDVISTRGGVLPTRIVAGQDRAGRFTAGGNIDNFFITGSLIDAVVAASVAPAGGNGQFSPAQTCPPVAGDGGYDAAAGYLTGGRLGDPVRYPHFAPGAYDAFGRLVGFVYDTTLDPVIDDCILFGAINASLAPAPLGPDADANAVIPLPSRSTVAGGVFRTPGAVDFAGLFAADTRGVFVGTLPPGAG
jgi:hypothetical protein